MAYNALHTALEAAVNAVLAASLCVEVDLTMSPRFELTEQGIQGAGFRVECSKMPPPLVVSLTAPTEREDGTPLLPGEVVGYEFEFLNGCVTGRTVTTDGLRSASVISCYREVE